MLYLQKKNLSNSVRNAALIMPLENARKMKSQKKRLILKERLYVPKKLVEPFHKKSFTYKIKTREGLSLQIVTYKNHDKYVSFCRGDLGKLYKVFSDLMYRVKDKRAKPKMSYGLEFTGELWRNQREAVDEWMEYKYGQLKAPARSGKTVMACYIICKLGMKTLILSHQADLLDQFVSTFEKFTNLKHLRKLHRTKYIVGRITNWSSLNEYDVVMSTYQAFIRERGSKILHRNRNSFGLLVVDECHLSSAYNYRHVVDVINSYYRMGLTATPRRKDELHILADDILGPVTSIGQADSMICKVTFIRTDYRVPAFSRWTTFINRLCKNKSRNKLIADWAVKDAKDGHYILIVTDRVAHAKELSRMINERGVYTRSFLGNSNRKEILEEARSGKLRVTVASRKITKFGIDVPLWSAYYNVCPIAYSENYYQEVSRIRTPYKGKPMPVVRYFLDKGHGAVYACKRIAEKVHEQEGFITEGEIEQNTQKLSW